MKPSVALVVFAVLGLAACGDSGSSGSGGDDRDDGGGADAASDAHTPSRVDGGHDASASDGDTAPMADGAVEASAEDASTGDAPATDGETPDAESAVDGDALDAAPSDAEGVDASEPMDAATPVADAATPVADAATPVADAGIDSGAVDSGTFDAGGAPDAASGNVITGGPCLSGAPGATAFRIRFINAGGEAQVTYEAFGFPDHSREQAGAYGYEIGFTPEFVDTALAQGGLQLDPDDFIDIEYSTVGVANITAATLSVYGRSYSVDTNGSFAWETFVDSGQTPVDFVNNVPPYQWYSADVLSAIAAGDGGGTMRITAGDSSDSLAVNAVELCIQAQ